MSPPRSPLDALLDASVYFSFDASGYKRHARGFEPLGPLDDVHVVVTGASGGLGLATAELLAARGARLTLLCRSRARGEEARAHVAALAGARAPRPALVCADLGDLPALDDAAAEVRGPVHALVHNAGLLPRALALDAQGLDVTVGAHVLGPLRLTARLRGALEAGSAALGARRARVVWVSSGGMYTARLSVDALAAPQPAAGYDGVRAYALTKRAQVELAAHMAARWGGVESQSCHPGWARTPGVEVALPGFTRWTAGRLRTPQQGADTQAWLAGHPAPLPSGFWFDRAARDPHLLGRRAPAGERARLWRFACERAGVSPEHFGDAAPTAAP